MMEANMMGDTMTTRKLKAQFDMVLMPLAAARTESGVISAGVSHVMPNQPMAKNVLLQGTIHRQLTKREAKSMTGDGTHTIQREK